MRINSIFSNNLYIICSLIILVNYWSEDIMKRKSILFGIFFVLALILIMPSIPSIEQKTIEDKAYGDFVEKLKDFNLKDIDELELIKHPILYIFVKFIYIMNCIRSVRIVDLAKPPGILIEYPLLYLYGYLLAFRGAIWFGFWFYIQNKFDWKWNMLDF